MNSQIMENVIQYYLHVYDSAQRIYSQNKSEYRTANYLYCGLIAEKYNVASYTFIPLSLSLANSNKLYIYIYIYEIGYCYDRC